MLKTTLKGSSGLSMPEDKPGHGAGEGGHTIALDPGKLLAVSPGSH